MMIPTNINRDHVIKAIEEVHRKGIPKGRTAKKYHIEFNGIHYPPKYIISLANKHANGKELNHLEFSGGTESNDYLKDLGFKIVELKLQPKIKHNRIESRNTTSIAHQGERCPKCKDVIKEFLEKIYGEIKQNYKVEIGTCYEDFLNTPYYEKIKEIYEALQNYRGFKEFVKVKTLPPCDFFISNPEFIMEFDESQHFTVPRRIALELYPDELEIGFNRRKWIALCKKINSKDNNPPCRDEQRAWYDTLRDFLSVIRNSNPTIRLFAKDYEWCNLNPNNSSDVTFFKNFLRGAPKNWKTEVKKESNSVLSRIIITDEWDGNPTQAKHLLEDMCTKWPKGKKVKFLVTCGGFIQFDWPKSISIEDVGDNINPNKEAINALVAEAKNYAKLVLGERLRNKLRQFTDYITLGIDSAKEKISTTQNYIGQLHVELVFLIDLRTNDFYWTGKSYPTSNQQKGLVRIANLSSHFFDLDVGKTMVLGCHDLTIFNPRSKTAKGWRKEVNNKFKELARAKQPIYVLHHPHTTVKRRTWLNAWNSLDKMIPSVEYYTSAGRYHDSKPDRSKWDSLDTVLTNTKCGSSIDFVVYRTFNPSKTV